MVWVWSVDGFEGFFGAVGDIVIDVEVERGVAIVESDAEWKEKLLSFIVVEVDIVTEATLCDGVPQLGVNMMGVMLV